MPIVARSKPSTPPIKPFTIDFDETLVIILIPNNASAKYSGALNSKATLASMGEKTTRAKQLNNPPNNEEKVEMPRARPGCLSLVAIGYPSRVVAAEAAVPGVLTSIAEIEPP